MAFPDSSSVLDKFQSVMYKGTWQETSKIIHIIFEGRKISSVSAKCYIFGHSGPSRISSIPSAHKILPSKLFFNNPVRQPEELQELII